MYGTIRMHQERDYPGRVSGTDLENPDFAAYARAFGGHGEMVETHRGIPGRLRARGCVGQARRSSKCRIDPEALTPSQTLSQIGRRRSRDSLRDMPPPTASDTAETPSDRAAIRVGPRTVALIVASAHVHGAARRHGAGDRAADHGAQLRCRSAAYERGADVLSAEPRRCSSRPAGKVADRFGSRTVFRAAIALFTLGSILCAQAPSLLAWWRARMLQGVGGAMMVAGRAAGAAARPSRRRNWSARWRG